MSFIEKLQQKLNSGNTEAAFNLGVVYFKGLHGEKVDYDFPASSVYSLTMTSQDQLEFYSNSDYFMIVPDEMEKGLIKWTLAAEEIHNLHDMRWKVVCDDVYEYEKGDICV